MNPSDFVYKQVFSGCTKEGCSNSTAQKFAMMASERYRKNQFKGNASVMITDMIKQAKQEQKLKDKVK